MPGTQASSTRRYPTLYRIWPGLYNWVFHRTEDWDFIESIFSGGKQRYLEGQTIYETYMKGEYAKLYNAMRPGTTLIDIGANIGDTAIYFAMHQNVRKVLSFEPIPSTYRRAAANIKGSPFSDKIKLFNMGIAEKAGKIAMNKELSGTPATRISEIKGAEGTKVKIVTLNDVLKGKKNVAIKCDCEGCEADIFDNADLREVYAIQLEYHYCYTKVRDSLRRHGFSIQSSRPGDPQGLIFAER
jgi:FkbM family methyltransferase